MTTMNISLPDDLKAFIDDQVSSGGYGSVSEYVRELIRSAKKAEAQTKLEALLLEGLDSGEPIKMTPEWWQERRRELKRRIEKKGRK